MTVNRKGKINGAEFDGIRIITQKGKKLEYTEDAKKLSKINEFKELVKNAELEHKKIPAALEEETLGVVNTDLTHSVLRNSIENLESFIDDKVAEIEANTIDQEKIREFHGITKTADHNLDNGGLKTQENDFHDLAKKRTKRFNKNYTKEWQTFVFYIAASLLKKEATPEDIYSVSIPALNANECIVPDTMALSFKFNNSNTKSWFLNNLGQLLIDRLSIKVQGVEVYQNTGESMLEVYKDSTVKTVKIMRLLTKMFENLFLATTVQTKQQKPTVF